MSKELIQQLKSFIRHVSDLEKADEFDEDGFTKEFKELRTLGITHREENKFPAEEGKKDQNIKKNRYKDILPFDATRVILSIKANDKESDYINANFVQGANGKVGYIAAQGPIPPTVVDFWRMLWEFKIQVVAMVCQEVEHGKAKCSKYWSPKVNDIKKYGDLHIKLTKEEKISDYFFARSLSVWRGEEESEKRVLTQYHYTGWMDHDIPHDIADVIVLINLIKERQIDESIPILIHCSAGCGRTGTICAIDYAWNILKGGMMSDDFSLYQIILNMRSQRQSMVQTPEQYKVVHLAVKKMFEDHLELIDQHSYENVELNKHDKKAENKEKAAPSKGNVKKMNGADKRPKLKAPDKPAISNPATSIQNNVTPTDKKPIIPHSKLNKPTLSNPATSIQNNVTPTDKKPIIPHSKLDKPTLSNPATSIPGNVTPTDKKPIIPHSKLDKPTISNPATSIPGNVTPTDKKPVIPHSKLDKPTISNPATSVPGNVTTTDKKPVIPHSKPCLSPKPAPDSSPVYPVKTAFSLDDQSGMPRSNSDSRSQKGRSLDYQNVTVDQDSNRGKFVTRITVNQNSGSALPKKPARLSANSAINTPAQKGNTPAQTGNKATDKHNARPPGKAGHQRPPAYCNKAVPNLKSPALNAKKVAEPDNKSNSSNARATSDKNAILTRSPQLDKKSLSKRAPAALPPDNSNAINKPYEDVVGSGGRDYSYAEPNSTDKWPLQELARKFDQHAGTKPSSGIPLNFAYEDIDVNLELNEGAYATVADDLSPPPVPVKTEDAYIYNDPEDEQSGKKKQGLINTLMNKIQKPIGHKTENEPNKGAVKQRDGRDDGVVVFNKKIIFGFNKRGKRPKGPRVLPFSMTTYESSL